MRLRLQGLRRRRLDERSGENQMVVAAAVWYCHKQLGLRAQVTQLGLTKQVAEL